ncbi:MAG: CHAT domain-containing protein [Pyrinomonadaceae bacterium]|nr:CHAT domain-containing protein [Pyrinomonadaceae bacterium]
MDQSEEIKQARKRFEDYKPAGTPVDQQEVEHFGKVLMALKQMSQLAEHKPVQAYQIGLEALAFDRSPPRQRAELHRSLGSIGLELGRVQEAVDHLLSYQEFADQSSDPLLILYAGWWMTLAIGYNAAQGLSIDGIMTPAAQFRQVLQQAKEAHNKSREFLGEALGRFVFVASAVDRVPILFHLDSVKDEGATAQSDLDEALQLIDQYPVELGDLRGHALKMSGLLEKLAGNEEATVNFLEEAVKATFEGSLKRGQALSSLGQAYLEAGRFEEARDAFEEAYATASSVSDGLGEAGDRILFGDQVGSVIRGLASAKLGLLHESDDLELKQKLRVELVSSLDWANNSELSRFLIAKHKISPAGSALVEVLERFQKASGRKARFCYLFADQHGTHLFQIKGDGQISPCAPLGVKRDEWASLWRSLADTYAPISRSGNPARPQDYLKHSDFPERWREAGEKLAAYLLSDGASGEHLYLVLDPWLNRLPVLSAAIGENSLLEYCSASVVPSAMALIGLASLRGKPTKRYTCLGTGTQADYLRRKDNPQALAAFHKVGDHLEAEGAVTVADNLCWEAASIQAFQQQLAQAQVGFVTAHAVFNRERGSESGLYLANDGKLPAPVRPNLTAAALGDFSLETDFLVLNACVVGLERQRGIGEGMGLSRALYRSGVRSHVASLWPVYLPAGNYFACRLYDYVQGGAKTYADAFRVAMRELRIKYPNPYHWAAFCLRGVGMSTYN